MWQLLTLIYKMGKTVHAKCLQLTILTISQSIFNLAEHHINMLFMGSICHYGNINVQISFEENSSNQHISLGNNVFMQCLSVSIWVFSLSTLTSATNTIMYELLLSVNLNDFNSSHTFTNPNTIKYIYGRVQNCVLNALVCVKFSTVCITTLT